ncbi:acyltransferase family protein [Pseudonocardia sp. MH-G8]|uniref:acyltransferase family protein n=1 Tax=Pseudonocardia sp. MH-G8 TaxID=1854588 RepID=UPI001E288E63|nr:acyltransferase family protein [Pseudonocardia sp. MH-G8]
MQGLRALAVALVVLHHVWTGRVSGGVDVFFVISGFLLTGQLARAAGRGPLELRRRWSRMVLRLLPAAATVLIGTVVAGAVLLPEGRWNQTVREVVATVFFVENWQLAADAVDYAARSNTTSVVQHFWSLSIQVQFFVVWPLLVALVALVAGNATHRLHTHLTLVLLGVFGCSLSFSVALTAADQPQAYFHSLTRVWEFALGGLLALWIDRVPWTRGERVAFGWIGVIGLLACGFVLDGASVFPGYAALWPVVCALLVLQAGVTRSRYGVDRFLTWPPARRLGDLSYPLYLWHWPVLMLFMVARDRDSVGLLGGLAVIALSVLLAVFTSRAVEDPAVRLPIGVGDTYRFGAATVTVVLIAASLWQLAATHRDRPSDGLGGPENPGAVALVDGAPEPGPLLPAPVSVYEDWVRVDEWDCSPLAGFRTDVCTQPVEAPPSRRVVVVGDSHLQQFTGALIPIAAQHGWQLTTMLQGACPFSTASEVDPENAECLAWNDAAAAEIAAMRPDAVVTLASRDVRSDRTEQTPPGFVERWQQLDELGIPVLAVRDNPRFDYSVPDCMRQEGRDAQACGADRDDIYAPEPPYARREGVPPNVTFLDLADFVCDESRCPAEIGNVLVYLDDNHLTAAYARTLAFVIEDRVVTTVG